MTYASQQDLVDRFGERELIQLTDRTNTPATTIDVTVVARAIEDADALIDSYVGKAFNLPLAEEPPILTKHACDIAHYYLHGDRAGDKHPVTLKFNQSMGWLKDVARGLVKLDDGAGDTPSTPAGGGKIKVNAPERIMSRESLRDS